MSSARFWTCILIRRPSLTAVCSIAIRDPKLHCVISQYEAGYKNIRVIPYSQYTDELGAAHGEFTLSREYIESMLRSTIDEEFLTLD